MHLLSKSSKFVYFECDFQTELKNTKFLLKSFLRALPGQCKIFFRVRFGTKSFFRLREDLSDAWFAVARLSEPSRLMLSGPSNSNFRIDFIMDFCGLMYIQSYFTDIQRRTQDFFWENSRLGEILSSFFFLYP